MDNKPRQKLCELISQHGLCLGEDLQRCEGLLRDTCGQYRKEIAALISVAREGIHNELLSSQNSLPPVVLLARLTKKMQENLALDEKAAKWAVESWALALGVLSNQDLNNMCHGFDPPKQPTSPFWVSKTVPIQSPADPNTVLPRSVTSKTSNSSKLQKPAILGSTLFLILAVGIILFLQIQQRQSYQQQVDAIIAKQEEHTKAEQRQREEIERQLEEDRLKRMETERSLEDEQEREKPLTSNETIDNGVIYEEQAISLIENLYYLLSEKQFNEANSLYSPQLADSFSSGFFSQFERVTVEDLQITSRTDSTINFRAQNTYIYPDGSTQREVRSYTVRNLDGELKITSSEFISVTKPR